jgi:hypothetical protein
MRARIIPFLLLPLMIGCDKKEQTPSKSTPVVVEGGSVVNVPEGFNLRYSVTTEEEGGGDTVYDKTTSTAKGPGVTTDSESVAQNLAVKDTQAGIDGSGGGGFQYAGKLTGGKSVNIFHVLGAMCLIFAAVSFWLSKDIKRSAYAALAGAVFIGVGVSVEHYPQFWALGALGLLIIGIAWCYDVYKNNRLSLSLQKIVLGVSEAPAASSAEVKASIGKVLKNDSLKRVVEAEVVKAKQREHV